MDVGRGRQTSTSAQNERGWYHGVWLYRQTWLFVPFITTASKPEIFRLQEFFWNMVVSRMVYWTGDQFLDQIKTACVWYCWIQVTLDTHTREFSSLIKSICHRKFDDKALIACNILVKDGGSHRVRNTGLVSYSPWFCQMDQWRGWRTILPESSINIATLRADDMRAILSNHEDFLSEIPVLIPRNTSEIWTYL